MHSKPSVHVIDDDTLTLEVISSYLGDRFQVTTFSNPENALRSLQSSPPDLVLLDIVMPQLDGLDLLARLRERNQQQKVIIMTGQSTLSRVLASHRLRACDYIIKPIQKNDLASKVNKAFEQES
jgi:DNA-binding NtrC family response regulator